MELDADIADVDTDDDLNEAEEYEHGWLVKHFGRSGRVKGTHLVREDTTDWNNLWTCIYCEYGWNGCSNY
ncbi:hypothetical protein AgCh_005589 [Apium graveolens]